MDKEIFDGESNAQGAERAEVRTESPVVRKPFVEPEISGAVAVLESTTFFQNTDSGVLP